VATSQGAGIAPIAICDGLDLKNRVGRICKKNQQLRQNGDLAGLDFVVNRTAYSVISRFYSSLEYIIASWLASSISCISSFPLAYLLFLEYVNLLYFFFLWKKQSKLTDSNKRKQHIRENIELVGLSLSGNVCILYFRQRWTDSNSISIEYIHSATV